MVYPSRTRRETGCALPGYREKDEDDTEELEEPVIFVCCFAGPLGAGRVSRENRAPPGKGEAHFVSMTPNYSLPATPVGAQRDPQRVARRFRPTNLALQTLSTQLVDKAPGHLSPKVFLFITHGTSAGKLRARPTTALPSPDLAPRFSAAVDSARAMPVVASPSFRSVSPTPEARTTSARPHPVETTKIIRKTGIKTNRLLALRFTSISDVAPPATVLHRCQRALQTRTKSR